MIKRHPFNLFVSIESKYENTDESILKQHKGYPIDNVVQIKLSKLSFVDLFKDNTITSSNPSTRYNSQSLLERLSLFFNKHLTDNHNSLASDITILISNTYNDVDINPVNLENACASNGDIFNYFFKSNVEHSNQDVIIDEDIDDSDLYNDNTYQNSRPIMVYEMIARELDNMISRNIYDTSSELYGELDHYYHSENFWNFIQEGDSIFIEGSFTIPTAITQQQYKNNLDETYDVIGTGNLPIILQFVCSNMDIYSTNNTVQNVQKILTTNSNYDISSYIVN